MQWFQKPSNFGHVWARKTRRTRDYFCQAILDVWARKTRRTRDYLCQAILDTSEREKRGERATTFAKQFWTSEREKRGERATTFAKQFWTRLSEKNDENARLPLPNNFGHVEILLYHWLYCKGGNCSSQVCYLLELLQWLWQRKVIYTVQFSSNIIPRFKTKAAVVILWLKICIGKKFSSFLPCVAYQWWEIRCYLHLVLIYSFSSKGRRLGDSP